MGVFIAWFVKFLHAIIYFTKGDFMSGEPDKTERAKPTAENPVDKSSNRESLALRAFVPLLIASMAVSVATVFVYDRYLAQKVAVLDIRGYLQERKDLFISGKITEMEFTASVDNLDATLNKIDKRIIVLKGDAVVRTAEKIKIAD